MFSHENIWAALDRLAATFGYSPSGLAKQAGLDPTSFNKSKRFSADGKARWPSTESIARVLAATGATMSDFLSLMDKDGDIAPSSARAGFIPVIGFTQAGAEGYFDEDGYPEGDAWDEVRFLDDSVNAENGTYALEISGDSMEPLYRNGDIIIANPTLTPRRGDRVVVRLTSGEVTVKELLRKTASKVELKSLNPRYENRVVPANDISWIARVLWVSQ